MYFFLGDNTYIFRSAGCTVISINQSGIPDVTIPGFIPILGFVMSDPMNSLLLPPFMTPPLATSIDLLLNHGASLATLHAVNAINRRGSSSCQGIGS